MNTLTSTKGLWKEIVRARWAYFFLAPALVAFLVFGVFPIGFAVWVSLTDWQLIGPPPQFIGLGNYAQVFADSRFILALQNTLFFTVTTGLGAAVLGLAAALVLNSITKGSGFFRTMLYLPVVTPIVAVVRIWQWLYSPETHGLVNTLVSFFGLGPFNWLGDPDYALKSLAVMTIWQGLGWDMVIFLAGLKGIPPAFYEAACIDGASPWQQFRYVTLPLLRPVTLFVLVMAGINGLKAFAQMFLVEGPLDSTLTVSLYVFKNAFDYFRMGYASAMAFILAAIILWLTGVQFWAFGRRGTITYE